MTPGQAIALAVLLGAPVVLIVRMVFFKQPLSGREHTPPDWMPTGGGNSDHHGGGDHDGGHG